MKIGNLLLLLAAPFNRIFGDRDTNQNPLPAVNNSAPDDGINFNEIYLQEEAEDDATSWLSKNMGAIYGMLKFPLLPGAEAVMVGDKNYKTTVYCGPEIQCDYLRAEGRAKKISLIEFDKNQFAKKDNKEVERLVLVTHGKGGWQTVVPDQVAKADVFAEKLFSGVKIIHALACQVGTRPEQNFAQNSLKVGQVLFLHAGNQSIPVEIDKLAASSLVLEPNSQFPIPVPLQVIVKKSRSKTVFAELLPAPLSEIAAVEMNDQKIDNIYDVIARHIDAQREMILEKFAGNQIIGSELERLGFRDFSQETDHAKKEEFVRNYLDRYFSLVSITDRFSTSDLESIDRLLKHGLMRVDNSVTPGSTAASMAAISGNAELLRVLANHGAILNKPRKKGLGTPAYAAAEDGNHQCLEVLGEYKADMNQPRDDGVTPAIAAARNGHHESLRVLAKYGADLDKSRSSDGMTPAIIAVQKGHYECVKVLAEKGANFNKANDDTATPLAIAMIELEHRQRTPEDKLKYKKIVLLLIRNGADPELKTRFGNAYAIAETDRAMIKEMKKARAEYLEKHTAIAEEVMVDGTTTNSVSSVSAKNLGSKSKQEKQTQK